MTISLIGGRGAGKSSVGTTLAGRLGWSFRDSDQEIVRRAGRPIAQIFAEDGEPHFRELESRVIAEILDSTDNIVLATGGGAVLNNGTRDRLRGTNSVVWLTAPAEVLADRIASDADSAASRPSLTGRSASDELADVLRARTPLYQQAATITEPTDGVTVDEIAESIVRRLGVEAGGRP